MDRFFPSNQQSSEPWFRVGNVDVTTTILIVAIGISSMFAWAINNEWIEPFKFKAYEVRHGQIWRLFTWPLVNTPSIWVVVSLAIFYLFGRETERGLGRSRHLWFLGILTVTPALVGTLVDLFEVSGIQMLTTSMFLVFVLMYPLARSWFEIPLWVFGAVFIGIDLLQLIGSRHSAQVLEFLAFYLTALLTATVLARGYGLLEYDWMPKLPMPLGDPGSLSRHQRKAHSPKAQRRGRRQRGPAEVIPIRSNQPTAADLLRQAEVDVLLDKISEHGLSSLTPEERRRLDEHSRRLRDER